MASSTSILVHNKKILLIKRDNKSSIPEPNTWQLPGGGVEESEDYFQAIQRELQEEIGIIPEGLLYLGSAPSNTQVFSAFLTDEEVSKIKLGNEGQKLSFFDLKEILEINLTKKLRFYLEKYKEGVVELIENGKVYNLADLGLYDDY